MWDGTILDGHNRYRICRIHDIAFDTVNIELPDRDEAKAWILSNQLSRRNLNPTQRGVVILQRDNLVKEIQEKARARSAQAPGQPQGVKKSPLHPGVKEIEEVHTDEALGKLAGIGRETVRRTHPE